MYPTKGTILQRMSSSFSSKSGITTFYHFNLKEKKNFYSYSGKGSLQRLCGVRTWLGCSCFFFHKAEQISFRDPIQEDYKFWNKITEEVESVPFVSLYDEKTPDYTKYSRATLGNAYVYFLTIITINCYAILLAKIASSPKLRKESKWEMFLQVRTIEIYISLRLNIFTRSWTPSLCRTVTGTGPRRPARQRPERKEQHAWCTPCASPFCRPSST